MAEEPMQLPKWCGQIAKPKNPNLVQSIDNSLTGDSLCTKLKLIQSNKELLERKIQEYERKLNRVHQ